MLDTNLRTLEAYTKDPSTSETIDIEDIVELKSILDRVIPLIE
jgi:hypothetical protein